VSAISFSEISVLVCEISCLQTLITYWQTKRST